MSQVPSIQDLYIIYINHSKGAQNSVFIVYVSLPSVKTWMEGTYDGGFGKMQIISNSFQNTKAYLNWFIILKVIDAERPVVICWGDNR